MNDKTKIIRNLLRVIKDVAPQCTNIPLHESGTANIATYRLESQTGTRYACEECIDIVQNNDNCFSCINFFEPNRKGLIAKGAIEKYKGEVND